MQTPHRAAVLYTHFPHYRRPVFDRLRQSQVFSFSFYYDFKGVDPTIVSGQSEAADISVRCYQWGPFMFQPGFLTEALRGRFEAYILLGNPYILTNWLFALLARLRGRKVLMWTHGWRRTDEGWRGQLRNLYYRLAHMLLLYGDRAKSIGVRNGFASQQLWPIYNSLDYDAQAIARDRRSFGERRRSDFLCVSRLVPEVRIDLAIEALAIVNRDAVRPAKLVVVGDGPKRSELQALAERLEVPVEFTGAIYDEDELAERFLSAAAVVSPGKVGLLVMHSLAYGTPVITHDNMDEQMPEVEAIVDGRTGAFFRRGDVHSLAEKMQSFLRNEGLCAEEEAIRTIEQRYTPEVQRQLIEAALHNLLGK